MSRKYAHMCCDEHIEIGHNDSSDDERCPMCRVKDGLMDLFYFAEERSFQIYAGACASKARKLLTDYFPGAIED